MRYVLYNHLGSANHGCEALVRTVMQLFHANEVMLLTDHIEEEQKYGVDKVIHVDKSRFPHRKASVDFLKAYLSLKKNHDFTSMDLLPYLSRLRQIQPTDVMVSIGGDIYCYSHYLLYIKMHQQALKHTSKSLLIGCSIEQESLNDSHLLNDLKTYQLISARESITYQTLLDAGLNNVVYCPDSAFFLKSEQLPLPTNFAEGNTVGLNVSPLVIRKEQSPGIVLDNYKNLIQHILKNTNLSVALIPHVVWENNDDRQPLRELYQHFTDTQRVILIPDATAPQLKWYISQCRFFIGARTHATIAAYSSGVPTIVVGYSVKSKGIAVDLFGTDENYVIPVDKISSSHILLEQFQWLMAQEVDIKQQLATSTKGYPDYFQKLKLNIQNLEKW